MSKLLMFDFLCPVCEHEFEELVPSSKLTAECPDCKGEAVRQISPVRSDWRRMGVDATSFPTAGARWEKMQREKAVLDKGSRVDGNPNLKMY